MLTRPWIYAYGLLLAGFVWVWANLPVVAIPTAGVDDGLFVRHSALIISGQWLGTYSQFTLAKGVGYPLWLALMGGLAIPVLLSQALLYAAAAVLLVRALSRWVPHEGALFALLILVLANPGMYSTESLRIIREGFYTPTLLMILALILWWARWSGEALRRRLALAAALGLALGVFYLTREESIWILPFLLGCLGLRALAIWRGWAGMSWRGEAPVLLTCLAFAVLPVLTVSTLNARHYGVFRTVEFRDPAYIAAYSALARLGPDEPSLIVLPNDRLPALFAASPAAAELRPYFEVGRGRDYIQAGCEAYRITPCDGEIRAAWFMWALRDATVLFGGYSDALAVRAFNLRLAEEVNAACDRGELRCTARRHSLAPPFRSAYVGPTLAAASRLWRLALGPVEVPDRQQLRSVYFPDPQLDARASAFLDIVRADLFVDVLRADGTPVTHPLPSLSVERGRRVLHVVAEVMVRWGRVAPLLQVAALLALLALPVLWRLRPERALWGLWAFCLGAYLLFGIRVSLLAYLDTVAIPSVNMLYLSPAMPCLMLGLGLPLVLLWQTLRPARGSEPAAT